jgi:hypothetical protein
MMEREKRGKGFNNNPELGVESRSSLIINGHLQLLPGTLHARTQTTVAHIAARRAIPALTATSYETTGTPFFHNLESPEALSVSLISADDLATITVNGDITVRGAAGGHVSTSNPYIRAHLSPYLECARHHITSHP